MHKVNKFIFWTPRILVILFALFLAIFSLDIFGNEYTFWETVVGLFMHNIPSFILLAILFISWKHELVGAIIFGLLGISGMIGTIIAIFIIPEGGIFNPMLSIVGVIPLIIGILFYLGWKREKKKSSLKKINI